MIDWREGMGSFVVVPAAAAVGRWRGGAEGWELCERARLRWISDDTAVLEPVGVLEVGGAQALALGDEHSPIAYLPGERLFVRWLWIEDDGRLEDLVGRAVRSLPSLTWREGPLFGVAGPLLMFDADRSGSEASVAADTVAVNLEPGHYRVDTCFFEPDDTARIDLHRMVAVPPG